MKRIIEPELLDSLPAGDPRAVHSRRDLRRVNFFMGHLGLLGRELDGFFPLQPPGSIVDLGAGDGSFMLRLARRFHRVWPRVRVTLVDRQDLLSAATRSEFESLGWQVETAATEVFDWLAAGTRADLMLSNLFLHHFNEDQLVEMFRMAARRTRRFVACEPRRWPVSAFGCKLLWLIGCNSVTRHDAAISVRAGFRGNELSRLWPDAGDWDLRERGAGSFSHCFAAKLNQPSP